MKEFEKDKGNDEIKVDNLYIYKHIRHVFIYESKININIFEYKIYI